MSPFRNATAIVEAEAHALEAAHRRARAALATGHRSLFVRRTARIAAGIAGTAVAAAVFIAMIESTGGYTRLLLAGWSAVPIAYAIAAAVASRVRRRALDRATLRTGDPFRDSAALRLVDLPALARTLDGRRVHASYAWPLIAITLLGPGTLHTLIGLALGASTAQIDDWLCFTTIASIHVFGYALVVAWRYPRTLRVWKHVFWATVLSLFPGALLLALPSVVVQLTGVAIALVGYLPIAALIRREAASADD